jgi:uncharacterized protein
MKNLNDSHSVGVGLRAVLATTIAMLLASLATASQQSPTIRDRIVFRPSGVSVLAEKAESPEARSRGLMHRTSLGKKEGMIFRFEESGYLTFWMYSTKIPLTIVFLNDKLQIVDIQDMLPCVQKSADLCKTYTSKGLARYAIELNQGFTDRYGIKVGDQVTIERGE